MWKMFQLLPAAIWQHIRNPGLVEAGESVCWYSFCLSWKPLSTHLAFAFRKLPCLSVLMVSTHLPVTQFLGLTFSQINKIDDFVVNPEFVLLVFCFSKLFVISSYFLSWGFLSCTRSSFALIPAAFPQAVIHSSNTFLVRPSTPFGTSTCMLPKSLVISLRYNIRCTHGIVVKL